MADQPPVEETEPLSYDDSRVLLDAVADQWLERAADLQSRGVINRFAVGHDPAGPYLEIRVSPDASPADRETAQALFGINIQLPSLRRKAPLRIVYIEGPAPRLLAAPPPPASGSCINVKDGAAFDGDNGVGTIGWCFELNGQPMCMSNWHVFCFDGNQSLRRVQPLKIIGQDSAVLFDFVPIQPSGNKLDIALALFNDPLWICGETFPCVSGTAFDVPGKLTPNLPLNDSSDFRIVGQTSGCSSGKLITLTTINVLLGGGWKEFRNQLLFDNRCQPGDSGSIVVRKTDNSVSGLAFAADNGGTYANPIWTLLDWKPNGCRPTPFGCVPRLTGSFPPL